MTKVIGLLERMQSQIEEEGKAEAAAYDKFACFCKDQADEKLYNIRKGNEKIAELTAAIENLEAEISQLDTETATAASDIADQTATMENNTDKRDADFAQYESEHNDLVESINRLKDAIADMEGSKGKMSGGGVKTDLLVKATNISKADASAIADVEKGLTGLNQTEQKR